MREQTFGESFWGEEELAFQAQLTLEGKEDGSSGSPDNMDGSTNILPMAGWKNSPHSILIG